MRGAKPVLRSVYLSSFHPQLIYISRLAFLCRVRGVADAAGRAAGQDQQAAAAAGAAAGELQGRGAGRHVAAYAQERAGLRAALHGLARDAEPGPAALPAGARQPHVRAHLLLVRCRQLEKQPTSTREGFV